MRILLVRSELAHKSWAGAAVPRRNMCVRKSFGSIRFVELAIALAACSAHAERDFFCAAPAPILWLGNRPKGNDPALRY